MKSLLSRAAVGVAMACMVFSPIAAQANTRAGDARAVYTDGALSQPGFGRDVNGSALANDDDDDDDGFVAILLALLGGAAVIAALIIIDDEDDQSPGT